MIKISQWMVSMLVLFVWQSPLWAGIDPVAGAGDPRIKVVPYSPFEVTQITTYTKIGTTIQISPDEDYLDHASGALKAFTLVEKDGGRLVLKPLVAHADTNLTIFTDKRTYLIELKIRNPKTNSRGSVKVRDPNLTFMLYYQYPEEESRRANARYKQRLEHKKAQMQLVCETKENQNQIDPAALRFNYGLTGDRAMAPEVVFDDGVFTYLRFPENAPIPAVYSVDNALNETVLNVRMEGRNLLVVEQLADRLTLRHGAQVVTVVRNPAPMKAHANKEEDKQYAGW